MEMVHIMNWCCLDDVEYVGGGSKNRSNSTTKSAGTPITLVLDANGMTFVSISTTLIYP